MLIIITNNESETEQTAASFARTLKSGDVVALFGDLGVGKTAFVRGLAAGLGYADRVTSPTFNLVHEYDCAPKLHHYDLYRLNGVDDLEELGYYDALDGGGILALEWSERIEHALPHGHIRVTLVREPDDNNRRKITIEEATS
jgi:tRNA threonylcarbamoyladenosine biosynthesis protein TsaE